MNALVGGGGVIHGDAGEGGWDHSGAVLRIRIQTFYFGSGSKPFISDPDPTKKCHITKNKSKKLRYF